MFDTAPKINFGTGKYKCMFRSSHFWFLVTFGNEVTKIQKYYVTFDYILQGKMEKMEKKDRKSRN